MGRRGDDAAWSRQLSAVAVVATCSLALAACSSGKLGSKIDPKYGVAASPRVIEPGQPVPKGGGTYRVGKPYKVAGRTYVPEEDPNYRGEGVASWYGEDFHGRLTANGEIYDMHGISAAHPTLPMPSYVRVTNLRNKRSLIVRVNDRGPYHGNRVIDLSSRAADLLGFRGHGLGRVRVEYVGRAPLEGSDDRLLMATLREGGPAPAPSAVMVASAKPFVPEAHRVVARGPAPLPPERPFDLGQPAERVAAAPPAPAAPERAAAREIAVANAAPRMSWQVGPQPVTTAPAYAPVADPGFSLTSGRGLY